jgi:glycosyltransferase involved in cell wall biosynthesis
MGIRVGIDASNIKSGGGLTHLIELVSHSDGILQKYNISKIIIFGGQQLQRFPKKPWLEISFQPELDGTFIKESKWKLLQRNKIVKKSCDILFVPGGAFFNSSIPYVSMSQNMLVFENKERNRFPLRLRFRYILLELVQWASFNRASGIIFISKYAKRYVTNKYPRLSKKPSTVIYHGISDRFRAIPKDQKSGSKKSIETIEILYLSIVNYYKHQWNVIDAVKELYYEGYNVNLTLIGPMQRNVRDRFNKSMQGAQDCVDYLGSVPFEQVSNFYKKADLFVFASSCENMPNILVEAMSAGLPIACSNSGPMPEILADNAVYFDAESVGSIKSAISKLLEDENLRKDLANRVYYKSKQFSWEKCSDQTFRFISEMARK